MAAKRIDSHIHFSDYSRIEDLKQYISSGKLAAVGLVSLPFPPRINFNPELLFAKQELPDICFIAGSFDWTDRVFSGSGRVPDLAAQTELMHDAGFDALKLWEGKPSLQKELQLGVDHPEFIRGCARAGELGMPVYLHMADPPVFWNTEYREGFPSFDELIRQSEAFCRALPDLTVIFPHLLFLAGDLPRLGRFLEEHPRAMLDLAPGRYFFAELARQKEAAREFFLGFRERILFGTDSFFFPEQFPLLEYSTVDDNRNRLETLLKFLETSDEVENPFGPSRDAYPRVAGLALPQDVLEDLSSRNHLRLFGSEPRKLTRKVVQEYLRNFRGQLMKSHAGGEALRDLEALTDILS